MSWTLYELLGSAVIILPILLYPYVLPLVELRLEQEFKQIFGSRRHPRPSVRFVSTLLQTSQTVFTKAAQFSIMPVPTRY